MNILFLTILKIDNISERGIYTDLIRKFSREGHNIITVSPAERRYKEPTVFIEKDGVKILKIKTFNLQKTNILEKGIGTILLASQFNRSIKKYLKNVKFDLVLYSTPPITFTKIVKSIKKKYNAKSYLLLKDIFPQNAVDIGMMSPGGLLHSFFRKKEKKMYRVSDHIGCMSPANAIYIKKHNKEIPAEKIEICPNSIEPAESSVINIQDKNRIREKFGIPPYSVVFIYGGNLGKPQGLDFLLKILLSNNQKPDRYFLIIGSGTEYSKTASWFKKNNFTNAKLLKSLPKSEYDLLVQACDVGLIFLDPRFTIPNYPSRLLSYLEYKMPVIAATDPNTDIGEIAENNKYGFHVINGDLEGFNQQMEKYIANPFLIEKMGNNAYLFLKKHYTIDQSYNTILRHFIDHVV